MDKPESMELKRKDTLGLENRNELKKSLKKGGKARLLKALREGLLVRGPRQDQQEEEEPEKEIYFDDAPISEPRG